MQARSAAEWAAKQAARRAEMEAGPEAVLAAAQVGRNAAKKRVEEAATVVEARRTEANKGAATAARSANIFAREKAKHQVGRAPAALAAPAGAARPLFIRA